MKRVDLNKLTDEEIVRLILDNKDPEYFEVIYNRYAQKVYNKSLGFVKSKVKAEDVAHDVFLKVFLKLGSFNFSARFSTWLFAITYNYCVDYVTREKRYKLEYKDYSLEEIAEEETTYENEILNIQLDRLKVIMDILLPEEKMILLLKYQDELTIKEIEVVTNLSTSAVKMRLKRSRDKVIQIYHDKYSHNVI